MEQKDYFLREIEKIGIVLKMIFAKLAGSKENFAITIENHLNETKRMLLNETGFDLDVFLSLNDSEIEAYLSKFHGMNGANIELLADILQSMGMKAEAALSKEYLKKALKLYELCNSLDKTFSFERENKINEIRNIL
jgi:hypothetical protein